MKFFFPSNVSKMSGTCKKHLCGAETELSACAMGKLYFNIFFSGLKAAKEFAKVWPMMKNDLIVTCSVYRASQKVSVSLLLLFYI